jgi:mRNA interferase RelE/StbE
VSYALRWRASAQKDVLSLEPALAERVISAIDRLANDPRAHGTRKLRGAPGMYRLRVGDYRVLYEIDDEAHRVEVARVRHRREVYR